MDSASDNSSSVDVGTGPATNLGELHKPSPLTEQGHGITINSHFEAQPSTLGNNPAPSSSISSSQNPFLLPSDAYESSPAGNPFHEPTKTNNKATVGALEPWQNQPPAYETVPMNAESHNPFPVKEKDTNAPPKWGLDSHVAAESSDDDIPVSSMPKHGQSGDVAGVQSSAAVAPGTNKGPEIQNPPVQVMERPGDSGTSSSYTFPSHVFARNKSNAPVEWSTASNESLFSIYMGNMSFSSEIPYFGGGRSTELDKPGEIYMPDQPNASPIQQPPTAPVNKFNDISQRTAELHEECHKITEAKAAETMREVIMETSRTNENVGKAGEDKSSNSHRQSDGSTKSFAFQS